MLAGVLAARMRMARRRTGMPAPRPHPESLGGPTPERRRAAVPALRRYLAQGEALMSMCADGREHPPVHQAEDWCDAVADELRQSFGPAPGKGFVEAPPGQGPPPDGPADHQRLWLRIQGRCDWLSDFTDREGR